MTKQEIRVKSDEWAADNARWRKMLSAIQKKVRRLAARQEIRVNLYRIISDAVESGVAYGYMRAYKHTDTPNEFQFKDELVRGVMGELCEIIEFGPWEGEQ